MSEEKIPQGSLARIGVAGKAAVKVGAKKIAFLTKRPFLSEERQALAKKQVEQDSAAILFQALQQLKGTALKIAQALSMESDLLPEAWTQELNKSFYQVPPLNRAVVSRELKNAYGDDFLKQYQSINLQADSAASLGQVHEAYSLKGERLALKIQYPGVAESIASDIALVENIVRKLPYQDVLLDMVREISERLMEEIDYHKEAEHTSWFKQNITGPNYLIPQVHQHLCRENILVTEYIEGKHLTAWLESNPSQVERNQQAQNLWDFFNTSFFDHQTLHADPNPGNFLFCSDMKLGILDFGCVKHFNIEFPRKIAELSQAGFEGDEKKAIELYRSVGSFKGLSEVDAQKLYHDLILPFEEWLCRPHRKEVFDFGAEENYVKEGREYFQTLMRKGKKIGGSPDFIFMDRTYYGLYRIFEKMKAQVQMGCPWQRVLSE